jgi:hypothetical protein
MQLFYKRPKIAVKGMFLPVFRAQIEGISISSCIDDFLYRRQCHHHRVRGISNSGP